jgi:Domain of unknown function (DUF4263)
MKDDAGKQVTNEANATIKPLVMAVLQELMTHYLGPLYKYVAEHPELLETIHGFLLNHDSVAVYVGRTHIAVEYIGSEYLSELKPQRKVGITYQDHSIKDCNLFEQIVGFSYDSSVSFPIYLLPVNENLLIPTNRGWDKLSELGWDFAAQNSIMAFNAPAPTPEPGKFARIINGMFFDADAAGLKTRRIKWLDFFPIKFDGDDPEIDSISFSLEFMSKLVEHDAKYVYPVPSDYKFKQLPKINRFIELWGDSNNSEPDITSFLATPENEFILTMKFGAIKAHAELLCEWQSEDKPAIRPDFFLVQPNGYADIVEFKLPDVKSKPVVGTQNRETFAAWLNAYVSQTRTYRTYFDDPNNRRWFEGKYGFKIHSPRRWLVVGRRSDFESATWREIVADFRDLEILTFDDLVDGVAVQFYKE